MTSPPFIPGNLSPDTGAGPIIAIKPADRTSVLHLLRGAIPRARQRHLHPLASTRLYGGSGAEHNGRDNECEGDYSPFRYTLARSVLENLRCTIWLMGARIGHRHHHHRRRHSRIGIFLDVAFH